MNSAVIYVSSDDQIRRNSANLPTQIRKCKEHCEHEALQVLRIFSDEGKSGRTTDRPAFQKLMQFCRERKNKGLTVVVSDLSRLARNIEDQAATMTELSRLKVKLHSIDEPMLDTTAAGRLSANLLGCINQYHSDSLSERVTYRMDAAIKAGRPISLAPLGYLNTRATVSRTRNVQVKGTHGPIIDETTFAAVQAVISGNGNHQVPHVLQNEDFPLRGFVRCVRCGKALTAGWSKGRSKRYGFYRCWTKGCGAVKVRKEAIEGHFLGLLSSMHPTEELLAELPELVKNRWQKRQERAEEEKRHLTSRRIEQETLNRNLIEKYVSGGLSQEDFDTLKRSIVTELAAIDAQLKALQEEQITMQSLIEQARLEVIDIAKTWRESGIRQKQEIQTMLWPQGLRYSHSLAFFEPANTSIYQDIQDFLNEKMEIGRGERI